MIMELVFDHEAARRYFPTVVGVDGKRYPRFRLTPEQHATLVDICHQLAHDQQLSVDAIRQYLAERGVPRSHGAVVKYLAQPCDRCRELAG
jgi:hypothetical protein